MQEKYASLWWNQIPNARKVIDTVVNYALQHKNIALVLSDSVPWKEFLVDTIKEEINGESSEYSIDDIEETDGMGPGEYLLQTYCKKEKRNQFRPLIGYAKFLAEADDIVLNSKILWVQNTEEMLKDWVSFVSDYAKCLPRNKNGASFILEVKDVSQIKTHKGIVIADIEQMISSYDEFAFHTVMTSELSTDTFTKQYLSAVLEEMTGLNVELGAECIERYQDFLKDPYKVLKESVETLQAEKEQEISFDLTQQEVEKRLWKAQIKEIFPLLEEYRGDYIAEHKCEIARCLPISTSTGQRIKDPEDVELGTLSFLIGSGELYCNEKDRIKISKYKDARNLLAHLQTLSYEQIKEL